MKPALARLHILLARESPFGLVIRHGTAKSVCTLLWDRRNDQFTLGQWLRGRIEPDLCDLSPDGRHFLYSARRADRSPSAWTAVSRSPYLKALAYYPGNGAGGWFVNDQEYCIPGRPSTEQDRESDEVRRTTLAPPESLLLARRLREGWAIDEARPKILGWTELIRPAGAGWELRHRFSIGYRLRRGTRSIDTHDWDWADMDGQRLVWTRAGCLWASSLEPGGLHGVSRLHDFNGMKFEALIAPYPGGEPVPSSPPTRIYRLRSSGRKPSRQKPDRSQPFDED